MRMLGRDCRENGHVEYTSRRPSSQPRRLRHLETLDRDGRRPRRGRAPRADPGVSQSADRQVGDALRKLAASWDGQDRWYLEALGLALEKRESGFLSTLFDGTLYGDSTSRKTGKNGKVALPPYFPVDRNEAFIATGTPDRPASAVSKYLGLAWRIHRREVLPVLERILPDLQALELQQAADDILERMNEPETADLVAEMAMRTSDPVHQRALLSLLARRLGGDWNSASDRPRGREVIERTLADPETAPSRDRAGGRHAGRSLPGQLKSLAEDAKAPEEVRVAAVEGLGSFPDSSDETLEQLIASVRGKPSSNSVAEAAVRAIARMKNEGKRLIELLTAPITRWACAEKRCGAWRSFETAARRSSSWPVPASCPRT